ncbi:MAG: hypothetical protein ACLQU1_11315 [Bryobacteraceae bacterium]
MKDFAGAQALTDQQRKVHGAEHFDGIARQVHPLSPRSGRKHPLTYRWTCSDSEWATDLVFRDAAQLRRLYPQWVHLRMVSFSGPDVLRCMGKKVGRQGAAMGGFELPITTDLKVRTQGVRIKAPV